MTRIIELRPLSVCNHDNASGRHGHSRFLIQVQSAERDFARPGPGGEPPGVKHCHISGKMFSSLVFQQQFFFPGYSRDVENGMEGNNSTCGMGKNGVKN